MTFPVMFNGMSMELIRRPCAHGTTCFWLRRAASREMPSATAGTALHVRLLTKHTASRYAREFCALAWKPSTLVLAALQ